MRTVWKHVHLYGRQETHPRSTTPIAEGLHTLIRLTPLLMPDALMGHLSPTVLPVERTAKRSTSVVHTVPSVYGLAPRYYRHTNLGSMGLLTTVVWRLILNRFVTLVG